MQSAATDCATRYRRQELEDLEERNMSCSHPEPSDHHAFVHPKADRSICRTDACGVCFASKCFVSVCATGFALKCLVCEQVLRSPESIAAYFGQCIHLGKANIANMSVAIRELSSRIHIQTYSMITHITADMRLLCANGDYSRLFCLAKVATFLLRKLAILSTHLAFFDHQIRPLLAKGACNPTNTKLFVTAANDIAAIFVKGLADLSVLRFRSEEYPTLWAESFINLTIDQFFLPRETAGPVPESFLYTEWRRDVHFINARNGCNSDKMASIAAEIQNRVASLDQFCAESFSAVADLAIFHIRIANTCPVHKRCPHENIN